MDAKIQNRLNDAKDHALDQVFDLVSFSSGRLTKMAKNAIGQGVLRLNVESLQSLLDSVGVTVKDMGVPGPISSIAFKDFVLKSLTQYYYVLRDINEIEPYLDTFRNSIMGEFDNIISLIYKVTNGKPKQRNWFKALSEQEINDYRHDKLLEVAPPLMTGLVSFCIGQIKSLEVVRRMKAAAEEQEGKQNTTESNKSIHP